MQYNTKTLDCLEEILILSVRLKAPQLGQNRSNLIQKRTIRFDELLEAATIIIEESSLY